MNRSRRIVSWCIRRQPREVSILALLVGLALLSPGAVSQSRAAETAGTQAVSALSPPLGAPRLVVRRRSSLDAPGYIFIAPKQGQTAHGPEIVDERGRPVWFHPGGEASDFRVQGYLGKPVLTWCEKAQ
jgi:hypothetical protein